MILGALGFILGGIGGFVWAGPAGVILIALSASVGGVAFGLPIGAVCGAFIGLIAGDYLYSILRKLDEFAITIAILSTKNWIWQIGVVGGGTIFGGIVGNLWHQNNDGIFMAFVIFSAFLWFSIGIYIAWKIEQKRVSA